MLSESFLFLIKAQLRTDYMFSFFRRIPVILLVFVTSTCTAEAPYHLETFVTDLDRPWSLAFLPDGSALVTEQDGRLLHVTTEGEVQANIENVPAVYFASQGGLFDVLLHPQFVSNKLIYLSFAQGDSKDNGTAIVRARLSGDQLTDVETIFRVTPSKKPPVHYGGRMVFLRDGTLLLTTGDGFDHREAAQDIASGFGKLMRMNDDGSPARNNPFPESPWVYSYGHRNPQGLAVSEQGVIWLHEHGPKGGDEVNRIMPGANYGWPAITFGLDYSGAIISPHTTWRGMELPEHYWVPSIAPSGLTVYEGELFPQWSGDLFVGALVNREVRRLEVDDNEIVDEESLFSELDARIRDVRTGPDGALYIITNGDPGEIIRVIPKEAN
jgi:glucose/arabinose dehydrogenase